MSPQDHKSPQTTRGSEGGELSRPDTGAFSSEGLTPSEQQRLDKAQEEWKAAFEKLLSLPFPGDEQVYTKAADEFTAKVNHLEAVGLSIQERLTSGILVRTSWQSLVLIV